MSPSERGGYVRPLARLLRRELPCVYPVVIRRRPLPSGDFGRTYLGRQNGRRVLVIELARDLPPAAAFMVLTHEWAHAYSWRPDVQENRKVIHHDGEFGVAYAEIWRRVGDEPG